jgi:hypothetical protein
MTPRRTGSAPAGGPGQRRHEGRQPLHRRKGCRVSLPAEGPGRRLHQDVLRGALRALARRGAFVLPRRHPRAGRGSPGTARRTWESSVPTSPPTSSRPS